MRPVTQKPARFILRRTRQGRIAVVERSRYFDRKQSIRYESRNAQKAARMLEWLNAFGS